MIKQDSKSKILNLSILICDISRIGDVRYYFDVEKTVVN